MNIGRLAGGLKAELLAAPVVLEAIGPTAQMKALKAELGALGVPKEMVFQRLLVFWFH